MKKAKFILPPSKLEIFINIWRFFVYYVYLGILAIGKRFKYGSFFKCTGDIFTYW